MRIIVLVLILICSILFGEEIEVKIISYPEQVILGEPGYVVAEMRNISGKEIAIARGAYVIKRSSK